MDFNKKLTLEGLEYYHSKLKTLFSNINKSISDETTRATRKENEITGNLSSHITNTSNPHSVTKAQVGLGNVENKSSATIRGEITKSNVTTALGYTPLNQTLKGANNGLAELDANGKVPSSQLPSYVDDVIEGYFYNNKFYKETAHTTEIIGETGKIYIDLSTNKTYRWSGSAFVVVSETLALGETSSTAYRGDKGKIAYNHSQSTHARTDATKVEASTTNGNIIINGTETTVYTHPETLSSTKWNILNLNRNSTTSLYSGLQFSRKDVIYGGIGMNEESGYLNRIDKDDNIVATFLDNKNYGDYINIPTDVATTGANGLMSSAMVAKLNGITDSADSVSFSRNLTSGTKVGTITINGSATDLYAPTNTDTHYTSKNVVGSSTATSNTTTALTNGNVYLNSVENGVVTSTHKISGSGATTVTTDTSGNIVISSTSSSFSGTVDGTTWNCIDINRTNSTFSGIQFLTKGTALGGIGTMTVNGDFVKVDNTGKLSGTFIDTTNYSANITSLPNLSGDVITKATKAGEGFRIKDTNNLEVGYFDAHTIGTTETEGETVLMAGNSKAKGTAGNSTGKILLYGDSSNFAVIKPSSGMTSNSAFVLPKTGGTLATTSDALNVRQQLVSTDTKLPLLLAHSTNTDTTQNIDSTLYRNNSIYANPSTGSLYANNFYGIASGIQVEEVMNETSGYGGTLKVYCIGRKLMIAFINGMWATSSTILTKTYSGEFNTALDTSYIAGIDSTNEKIDSTIRYATIESGTRDIKIKNFTTSNCHATLVWLIS